MFARDQCVKCLCKQDAYGKPNKKRCMKINCGFELYYARQIEDYCAVAYNNKGESNNFCCPNDFICRKFKFK